MAGPMNVNLMDLSWWQAIVGIIGILGLSPAPWLLGLATGKIQFSRPAQLAYEARVKEIETHNQVVIDLQRERYEDLKTSRNYYRDAFNAEHERANQATEAVTQVLEVATATNHVLNSITQAAKEVAP